MRIADCGLIPGTRIVDVASCGAESAINRNSAINPHYAVRIHNQSAARNPQSAVLY